jgi:hypothetical protein
MSDYEDYAIAREGLADVLADLDFEARAAADDGQPCGCWNFTHLARCIHTA